MEKIEERLPDNFFKKNSEAYVNPFHYNPCEVTLTHNSLFYIPLKDHFPILDNLAAKNQKGISLLYVQPKEEPSYKIDNSSLYPLETMFECYKDSIPSYNFNEFQTILLNELQSTKNDQEILENLLETFGYEAIDFLTEIIRHRNNIEYSVAIYGNCVLL